MIGLQDAFDLLLGRTRPLSAEAVPLDRVAGRAAAETVTAGAPVPDFHRAMMDGYAVRVADVAEARPDRPRRLRITGRVVAGEASEAGPGPGEAWEITTGTPLPGSADGVVPHEWTRVLDGAEGPRGSGDAGSRGGDAAADGTDRAGDVGAAAADGTTGARGDGRVVEIRRPLEPTDEGSNVAPPGEDVAEDARIVRAGEVARPTHVSALAALGRCSLSVHRRPRVAVLSTGDELVPAGSRRRPGQIFDANRPAMAAAVRETGAEVTFVGRAPDRRPALLATLEEALASGPDAVVTTGGVSAGPRDLVPDVVGSLGAEPLFHGVAIKPGKPVLAADLPGARSDGGSVRILALSGTPVANAAAFAVLGRPMLLRLAGRRDVMPRRVTLRVREGYPKKADMTRLLWCRIPGRSEPFDASLRPSLDRPRLQGVCRADGLAIMPAGTGPWSAGRTVGGLRLDRPPARSRFRFGRAGD